MKKGERVLCLKRQLSDIPGFRLTVILSTRYEYLSKKNPPGHSFPHRPGLFVWVLHLGKTFHFIGLNFP